MSKTENSNQKSAPVAVGPAPIVVGVAGHTQFCSEDDRYELRKAIERVFSYLEGDEEDPELGRGLGLRHTPIAVLSSLAPGADTLVAEIALKKGWEVKAPLPLPEADYLEHSSVFNETDAPSESSETKAWKKENRRKFEELIGNDQVETFVVRMAPGEGEKEDTDNDEKASEDAKDPVARKRRYKAAGAYQSTFSHVMIALWDGDQASGTGSAVRAKRYGLDPGLLPMTTGLAWADNGPVIHIAAAKPDGDPLTNPVGTIQMLHPIDCRPSTVDRNSEDRWRKEGDKLFRGICERTEDFNKDWVAAGKNQPELDDTDMEEAEDMLDADEVAAQPDSSQKKLKQLAAARRRSSALSIRCGSTTDRVFRQLFWLVFFSALFFHLYAHWIPDHEKGHGNPPVAKANESENHHVRWLLAAQLATAGLAWWAYRRFRSGGAEHRDLDYRALSEAIRVQFYWAAAGLHRSVAANYMQRQLSELDWIRNAVSAISFPYSRWQDDFAKLDRDAQLQRLKVVREKWVGGQWYYFQKNTKKQLHRQHFFHQLGFDLAFGGLILTLLLMVSDYFAHWTHCPPPEPCLAALIFLSTLILWKVVRHFLNGWQERVRENQLKMIEKEPTVLRKNLRKFVPPSVRAILAAGAAMALVLLIRSLSILCGGPSFQNLWIIAIGVLLVGGAMLVAYGEKTLAAEHSRQYASMEGLYRAANRRLGALLGEENPNWKKDKPLPVPEDPDEWKKRVEEVQEILFQLGKESLDENAEWLILHRARPLEMPMAG